jgi:hypothetical protein
MKDYWSQVRTLEHLCTHSLNWSDFKQEITVVPSLAKIKYAPIQVKL